MEQQRVIKAIAARHNRRHDRLVLGRCPFLDQSPEYRQNDRPNKEAANAIGYQATDDAYQNHRHRGRQAACHDHRSQNVVGEAHWDDIGREHKSARRIHLCPGPDDNRKNQYRWPDLYDSQEKGEKGEETSRWNSGDDEAYSSKQCLKKRDSDNASRNVADGAADKLQHLLTLMAQDPAEHDPK